MRRPTAAVAAALGVLASCLLAAAPAAAHGGDPNYRSEITSITPDTPGLSAEIENFDADLRLVNDSDQRVVVLGYNEEPYLRFEPDGLVYVNRSSPAAYLNSDRYGRVDVPAGIDPKDPPEWEQVSDTGEWTWHDHRSHYMGDGVPGVVEDQDVRTKVFDYSIPIEVGSRAGSIDGTLYWVGQEDDAPVLPFVILGIVALGSIALVVVVRRRRRDDAGGDRGEGDEEKEAW
ncbi:MAG: hypothetical protein U0R24_13435 [Solirubrobacterales bacterium]